MDMLAGQQLIDKQGQAKASESVLNEVDIVGYYFSAHWCPPCRMFTPILADFYRELKENGKRIEIIFVSSDRSQQEMFQYMAESHADWMAVPWGSQLSTALKSKYNINGIPAFIVVKKDGRVVTTDGRSEVHRLGTSCFQQWLQR